jgi:hypothetical protein
MGKAQKVSQKINPALSRSEKIKKSSYYAFLIKRLNEE